MLDRYPNAPVFILGDFNNCRLETVLPSFKQYVDIPTRKDNVLDLCYGNISNAYRAQAQPPLGSADHNIVCLLPQYMQLLKRYKPKTYSVNHWSEEAIASLQGSLACTDWSVFEDNLNNRVEVITTIKYFKYSDDTAILSLLSDNDSVTAYQQTHTFLTLVCR